MRLTWNESMTNHKHKLTPRERLTGNAVLTHLVVTDCTGRLILVRYKKDTVQHHYETTHQCVKCGKIIESKTNKAE